MIRLFVKGYLLKERCLEGLKAFYQDESGMGVVEIAIIIIVLIGIALIFQKEITEFVKTVLSTITETEIVVQE